MSEVAAPENVSRQYLQLATTLHTFELRLKGIVAAMEPINRELVALRQMQAEIEVLAAACLKNAKRADPANPLLATYPAD